MCLSVCLSLKSYCDSSKIVKSSNLFYYYKNYIKRQLCGESVTNDNRKKYMIFFLKVLIYTILNCSVVFNVFASSSVGSESERAA